jgi:hypothetical protein
MVSRSERITRHPEVDETLADFSVPIGLKFRVADDPGSTLKRDGR